MAEQAIATLVAQLQLERQQTQDFMQQTAANAAQDRAQLQALIAATQAAQAAAATAASAPPVVFPRDDTKHLGKIKEFDGRKEHWHAYSYKLKTYLLALDGSFEGFLATIEGAVGENTLLLAAMHPPEVALARRFYNILLMSNTDDSKSYKIVERANRGEGALAWYRLLQEYEPTTAGHQAGMMLRLMKTRFVAHQELTEQLISLDLAIDKYEAVSKETVPDAIRVGIIQMGLSDNYYELQEHPLALMKYTFPLVVPHRGNRLKNKNLLRNVVKHSIIS